MFSFLLKLLLQTLMKLKNKTKDKFENFATEYEDIERLL